MTLDDNNTNGARSADKKPVTHPIVGGIKAHSHEHEIINETSNDKSAQRQMPRQRRPAETLMKAGVSFSSPPITVCGVFCENLVSI